MMDRYFRIRPWAGGWGVFANEEDEPRVTEPLRSQGDAVIHAKELARSNDGAQILVYDEHGKLVSEFFYQHDERAALASDDTVPSVAASRAVTKRVRSRT
jgi:hypothetical protein